MVLSELTLAKQSLDDMTDYTITIEGVEETVGIATEGVINRIAKSIVKLWEFIVALIKKFLRLFSTRDKVIKSELRRVKYEYKINKKLYFKYQKIELPLIPSNDELQKWEAMALHIFKITEHFKNDKEYNDRKIRRSTKALMHLNMDDWDFEIEMRDVSLNSNVASKKYSKIVAVVRDALVMNDGLIVLPELQDKITMYIKSLNNLEDLEKRVNAIEIARLHVYEKNPYQLSALVSRMSLFLSNMMRMYNAYGHFQLLLLKNMTGEKDQAFKMEDKK